MSYDITARELNKLSLEPPLTGKDRIMFNIFSKAVDDAFNTVMEAENRAELTRMALNTKYYAD